GQSLKLGRADSDDELLCSLFGGTRTCQKGKIPLFLTAFCSKKTAFHHGISPILHEELREEHARRPVGTGFMFPPKRRPAGRLRSRCCAPSFTASPAGFAKLRIGKF
ncbi:hypothetical protein, partial [Neisseria gonorrhoeae]|uniref:hypothetical protein n=1 Tax=Neisseria gonorrhoeae TaxID=485 RepID=UPI001E5663B8